MVYLLCRAFGLLEMALWYDGISCMKAGMTRMDRL